MKSKHIIMATLLLTIASFSLKADAQVVNSGASKTSSNSAVTLTATLPSIVNVNVDPVNSVIAHEVSFSAIDATSNTPSQDFHIVGNVLVNKSNASVQCQLSTLSLDLANGSDKITTKFTGTIGGTAVSTSNFTPTFTSKKAAIDIAGDIDESTISSADEPGSYAGTLTITATLQ